MPRLKQDHISLICRALECYMSQPAETYLYGITERFIAEDLRKSLLDILQEDNNIYVGDNTLAKKVVELLNDINTAHYEIEYNSRQISNLTEKIENLLLQGELE